MEGLILEKLIGNTQIFKKKIFHFKDIKKLYYGATMAVAFLHKINIEKSLSSSQ